MRLLRHDTIRRAVRTFVQAGAAGLLVAIPTDLLVAAALHIEARLAAAFAAVSALIGWLHGELEDAGWLPDTRTPPDEGPDHG